MNNIFYLSKIIDKESMCGLEVYTCNNKVTCRSYKNEGLVKFEFIQSEPGYVLEDRKEMGVQWIFLLEGKLQVEMPEHIVEVADREMFLLCAPIHRVKVVEKVSLIYFVSDYPTEYCAKMLSELIVKKMPAEDYLPLLPIAAPLEKFLELLLIYLNNGIDCEHLFREKQQELFMILQGTYTREEKERFLFPLTVRTDTALKKSIIENSFYARNVQELAQRCGYSLNSFKKVFKDMFNEPVYQWMLKQKAERLKDRLACEGVNLKEVINEFGFSSPAHFTKFCKQWLGMIPTKFIEKVKERQEQLRF